MLYLAWPWLLILLPLPLLLHRLLPAHKEPRRSLGVPFMQRLIRITGQKPSSGAALARGSRGQRVVLVLSWIMLILALARPQWIEDPITKTVPTRDLLLAVDLSGSMETEDFTDAAGRKIDRLTAAKEVLDDFLTRRQGDRVGLIFFGSAAYVQVPFTQDLEVCRTLLDEARVRMAGPQTVIGDAIGLAIKVFEDSLTRDRVLILLTDGNDTGSRVPPAKAARIAKDKDITIHPVAMGDPEAVGEDKLDEVTLESIAQTTGGIYFHGENREALEQIYLELDQLDTRPLETISHRPKRDLFQFPLALFFILGLLFHIIMLVSSRKKVKNGPAFPAAATGLLLVPVLFSTAGFSSPASGFHFLRPWWLAAFVPAAILVWLIRRRHDPRGPWRGVIQENLLRHLMVGRTDKHRLRPWHVLILLWLLTILGLAGPAWRLEPSPFAEDKAAMFIVMKITPSMKAQDIQPSRLQRAEQKVKDLVEARKGAQNGLIAYAGSAHLVMPLTRDGDIIISFAQELSPEIMPREGDALDLAIETADQWLIRSGIPGSIVLMADAVPLDLAARIAEKRKNKPFPVNILGVAGGEETSLPPHSPPAPPIDRSAMKQAARLLNGSLTVVTPDNKDVQDLVLRAEKDVVSSIQPEGGARWRDNGFWLIPVLTLLSLFWSRPGWLVRYE